MANKAIDKHYLLESLKDFYTTILLTFFQKKLTVTTVPDDPENGDVIIYVGTTSGDFVQGHTYKYSSSSEEWSDITPAGSGGGTWGSITGTLSNQTDLQTVLDEKAVAVGLSQTQYDALPATQKIDETKVYFITDKQRIWSGSVYPSMGTLVWTDGNNIYYSNGTGYQYKLNGNTWETVTWSGFTNIYGSYIWSYGNDIYYSNGSSQYKLNGTTWESVNLDEFDGHYIWTDGTNVYYSHKSTQCKFNGTSWETMMWTGYSPYYGDRIWTDGTTMYYSYESTQLVFDGDRNWSYTTWSGFTEPTGLHIWNNGADTYYSDYSNQYKLNGTTWEPITWAGFTPPDGALIWHDGNDTYYSYYYTDQYKLNGMIWENYIVNSTDIYYKNIPYGKNSVIVSGGFAVNAEYVNIDISSLNVGTYNYGFKYYSTVEIKCSSTSYNSSTGIFTVNFKQPASTSGTFYIEAHKIS